MSQTDQQQQQQPQEQDKSMDKKEIAEEEREKMLNAENTKHTGAAPAPDLEAEDHKPKRKIPIGGIKMPGFCRSKSKEPCKVSPFPRTFLFARRANRPIGPFPPSSGPSPSPRVSLALRTCPSAYPPKANTDAAFFRPSRAFFRGQDLEGEGVQSVLYSVGCAEASSCSQIFPCITVSLLCIPQ
jgi:hypothetical protein